MKQTAVEWFAEQIGIKYGSILVTALEMKNNQIIDAWYIGKKGDTWSNMEFKIDENGNKFIEIIITDNNNA